MKFQTRWDRFKHWFIFGESYKTTRLQSFKCWVVYGHNWDTTESSTMAGRTMNTCRICGKVKAGPG